MIRRTRIVLIIFGFILAIVTLHVTSILIPIEDGVRTVLAPVGSFVSYMGTNLYSRWANRDSISECKEKNDDLNHVLASISVDYVKLKALEEENAVLRKTLGYLQENEYDYVVAHVISRSVVANRAVIMIDRGAKHGLEIGMAVVVEDGIYLGKITRIQEHTAVVTLTADLESKVAISKAGENNLIGLVEGQGNGTAIATLIPQQEVIQVNDILVTSGTEDKIPADLIVGIVNRVIGEPTDPFKNAALQSVLDPDSVDVVAVLRSQALRPQ